MFMPNFLSPWWGLAGLIAIPLIALYLLRQKRPDMVISSTLLWTKALSDMRASTPFQKLRRNLLLLLQLLVLAALVFALMRPVIQAKATSGVAGVIVIDAKATMQTTDNGGQSSRLDRAKEQATTLVDSMRPDDRFTILVDGGGMNHSSMDFTADKALLKQFIREIQPSDTMSDLSETLLMAATKLRSLGTAGTAGTAAPSSPSSAAPLKTDAVVAGKIWLLSDGAGVRLPQIAQLESMLQYVKIGESSRNVGLTRLAVTPVPKAPKTYQIFASLINTTKDERTVPVGLAYGAADKFIDVKRVTVPAGGQAAAIFQITLDPGKIFVQLDGKDDDFKLDNTAYGLLEAPRKVRVILVTAGNAILERFLKTASADGEIDGQIVTPTLYKSSMPADLVIYDGPPALAAKDLPKADVLFIRPIIRPGNSIGAFKIVGKIDHPAILRWKRDDPIMAFVELGDVRISQALRLDRDMEATELIASPEGPLALTKDVGSARQYLLGFDPLLESNWWANPSLLIFLQNVLDQTRARRYIGTPQLLPAGQAARLWDLADPATVTLPTGQTIALDIAGGAAEFPITDHVGFYEVHSAGKAATFAVNLPSQDASRIEPKSLEIRGTGNVQEATSVALVNREIWSYLALAALAVLLAEWFVYHRRIA